MKYLLLIIISLITIGTQASEYQLGVILGAPTGLSGKMELAKSRAIDAAIAYSFSRDLALEIHADYLVENAHIITLKGLSPLTMYYGIGGRLASVNRGKHDGDIVVGPRAPIGLNTKVNNPNIDLFGEVALVFDLIPYSNVDIEAGIGIRYRF